MSTYEFFVTLHLIGAVSWVGGNTMLFFTSRRVLARDNGQEVEGFMSDVSFLGPRFFIPISLVTVVFGALAVVEGPWSFGDPWVSAGLTMFIISFLIGATYVKPRIDKLDAMGEAGESGSTEYKDLIGKVLRSSRVELALLWVIVVVMVIKPT